MYIDPEPVDLPGHEYHAGQENFSLENNNFDEIRNPSKYFLMDKLNNNRH